MSELGTESGYVTFRIGEREFAAVLDGVREVLRLVGLQQLPGMTPPMVGVVELRGAPLPVMELRSSDTGRGDVLVLADSAADGAVAMGVAVDGVTAVRGADELRRSDGSVPMGLPAYVVEVLRDGATGEPVLLVDLRRMLELAA